MYDEVKKVKMFNIFLFILISFQCAISMSLVTILIYSYVNEFLTMITVISAVLLLMICLPLSIQLYWSSTDKNLKIIFLGLAANYFLLSISGILWYLMPVTFDLPWLVPAGKMIMIMACSAVLVTLFMIVRVHYDQIKQQIRHFIIFVNAASAFLIVYFMAVNIFEGSSNAFDILVYGSCVLIDIGILTQASILLIIYMPTKYRYAFSIILADFLLSIIGDSLNLVAYLGMYDTFGYSQFFYDLMLIVVAVALVIYSLSGIRPTTIEEVNKELYDTKHLMHDLIMQSPDGICICDINGGIILSNKSFKRMFDLNDQNIAGFSIFNQGDKLSEEFKDKILRVKKGSIVVLSGLKLNDHDSMQDKYVSMKVFPTYSSENKISSYIVLSEDITERKRAEEELLQEKMQVELYIDLMGHDINNMNQIGIGYLEMALDTFNLNDDNKTFLVKPLEALENSSNLIQNVRKIRKLKTDNFSFEPVDLEEVLLEAIQEYSDIPGRDISIEYDGLKGCVLANPLVKDIFTNLLNNSVKHSNGPIIVKVRSVEILEGDKKYYRIEVEDDGPGIPDDMKPIVFDRMHRSKTRTGGNGLGLYLVNMLVETFNGTINVEDRVSGDRTKGTRFIVMLPAAENVSLN
ncbi:hypothetical protein CUJ83_00950 [Methanocella sp. CWC-04]|uniref:histidine kinase n=1 Tax=Methanooceanicella nereidis TaxID=2052831 RepID=A0AAP2W5P2_9EURY|nr:PAS domain-containing sensor histidine kinase [Methanocella sp. CWC-04]MCD1293564.1 hypothetical protein [Methanocella sp. CWC-04]